MIRHMFFNGFHPVIPWCAFLLVGMVLGRMDMRSRVVRRRVFVWGAGIALVTEVLSLLVLRAFSGVGSSEEQELVGAVFGTGMMPPMPMYMLAGEGAGGS